MLVKSICLVSRNRYNVQLNLLKKTTQYVSSTSSSPPWTPSGLIEIAPVPAKPFLKLIRIDKPTGTFLLFWPASWGLALASPLAGDVFPDVKTVAIFAAGSFLMRGAACIINDIWDRKYDQLVDRTKTRPLASGELTTGHAIGLLSILLSSSLACLIQLNWLTIAIGVTSVLPTIAYPLAKRYTYWPQVALGATINYGAIMGFTSISNELNLGVILPLYLSAICWTVIYDTIYAHQDKKDDSRIGVKSTALKFNENTKPWLSLFATGMVTNMGISGIFMDQSWPFYISLVAASIHFSWQISTLNIKDKNDCWRKFNSNQWIGALILVGILSGSLFKQYSSTCQ